MIIFRRRFKDILKWAGIVLILVVTGITATVFARQNLTYEAPLDSFKRMTDKELTGYLHQKDLFWSL